jgi:Xaa-Pro aminopeptidase
VTAASAPSAEEWWEELDGRRAAALRLVEELETDALVAFGSDGHAEPFRYLTNFQPLLGSMWLVLPGTGEPLCAVDFHWQLEEARRRSGIARWHGAPGPVSAVLDWIADRRPRRVAVAGLDRLPVTEWRQLESTGVELVDAGSELAALRRRKSALELRCLLLAAQATDEALDTVRAELRPGLTEREIAARLGYLLRHRSGEWAFTPVVVSGVDDPIPIREPLDRRLEEGDTVMVDVGGSWDGYQADVSRTWVLGEAAELQLRVWDVVERAHAAAVAGTQPGVVCSDVAAAAARVVHDAGLDLAHRVGHGIGLATSFEWPSLDHESERLDAGMTFCIEPGVCLTGAGTVKLEDDVVVTADGRELLSNASRELQVDV